MPRLRTSSLPDGNTSHAKAIPNPVSQKTVPAPQTPVWKPPRKAEGQLDNDAIQDQRGGPLTLDELQLNVVAKTPYFLVLNKSPDVRLDGDFNVTIEKAMHRDYPDIHKFRWIHQLDFATSGLMIVGLTKESTAAASALFAKKCVEKEYLALVHGIMPVVPPPGTNCCTFSRLGDFIHDRDNPKTKKKQHEHKFTKSFKGPRTGPSLFAMDQGVIRRKQTVDGTILAPEEVEFLRKKWNDLSDDVQQTYHERAAADKLRFDAQVKALECQQLPQVRYDVPLQSSPLRPRSVSEISLPTPKRSRHVAAEPIGYIFDDSIATSTTNSFQMEISPSGKASSTLAFVLGHGTFDGQPVTKVLLRPLSGRRHQLRLHLSHHGFPIVGDVTYGSDDDSAPRMMLHAWKLHLKFPSDQQRLYGSTSFKSPDPFAPMVKTTHAVSTMQLKQQRRQHTEESHC